MRKRLMIDEAYFSKALSWYQDAAPARRMT
jgi:hypothetical protein